MSDPRVAALRKAELFSELDEATLADVAERSHAAHYEKGQAIVSELEFGADVYVIVSGEAEISIAAQADARQVVGKLGPGGVVGEMSSLTGELRSATVTALVNVEALVIDDENFDDLRERRPEIAVALVRKLASRLGEVEQSIDKLLAEEAAEPEKTASKTHMSIRRVWRELVVDRSRDLAFLTLTSFVIALIAVRLAIYASFTWDIAPRQALRIAYMTGFALLGTSACASLLTFRPGLRRVIALAYGAGCALIFNELGVTLAFDIFYKDIHTRDTSLVFDVHRLYMRTEPIHAIAIGLAVLVQAAYLRRFYARVWFVFRTRLRKVF